ncbi:cation transporter [bacterium]|jgi:predicted Co/Zn/Cd cation transporter (cation efflux family)|nr:cation transporter [bacterium]
MNTRHEQNILTFSACGALFFALLALTWGVLAKSQMIMFDGVYSFISLVLTGLYFYAARSIAMGRDENFPFGRAQMEPMVIVVQSIALIIICIKAFSAGAISLFSGGQEINNLSGMAYAAIGVIGCFISWYYIVHAGGKNSSKSELIRTLSSQWLMDTLLSLAVLIGFFIGLIFQYSKYSNYSRYIDPLMVMAAVLFFVRQPILSFIEGIKGILIMAPEKTVYSASKEAVKNIAEQRGFEDIVLRLGKSGRELVYEISFIAKDPNNSCSIGEMDAIRREVEEKLHSLFDRPLRLCVSFAHDRKLC